MQERRDLLGLTALTRQIEKFPRILVVFLGLALSFWPMETKHHSLMPYFAQAELGLTEQKPWLQGVNKSSPVAFNFMIGLDFADDVNMASLAAHEQAVQNLTDESLANRRLAYPWRHAKSIAIPVATFMRDNICKLRITIDSGLVSQPVDCRTIADNELVSFDFDEYIRPGMHRAVLESTAEEGQEIAPYYATDKNNENWIVPFQGRTHVCFWNYMFSLVHRDKVLACCYAAAMVVLFVVLLSKIPLHSKLILIYGSAIAFTHLSTEPFSGHDETAHVSMFYKSQREHALTALSEVEFNRAAWQQMAESEFFRLHGVPPRISDECPHSVLGHCGVTASPVKLYARYAIFLKAIGLNPTYPRQISIFARYLNVAMIVILILVARLLLRNDELASFMIALIFLGAMVAQSASLTNDMPMYILGCFALLVGLLIVTKGVYVGVISLLSLLVIFFLVKWIDVSSTTTLPLIAFYVPLITMLSWAGRQKVGQSNTPRAHRAAIVGIGCMIVGVPLLAVIYSWLSQSQLIEIAKLVDQRAILLQEFQQLSLKNIPAILFSYWKSYIGTYVWGHSYWPVGYYVLALAAFGVAFYEGLQALYRKLNKSFYILFIVLMIGLLSIQLNIILSIAAGASNMSDPIARDSFAKVRLSAPLAVSMFIVPLFSYGANSREDNKLGFLMRLWLLFFALATCFWLPTRFFFADLF